MPASQISALKQTPHALVNARLTHVRGWLDETLTRLTPEHMEWAPTQGMRTIAGQLVEIISVEVPLVPRLRDGGQLTDLEVDAVIGDQHNFESLKRALIDVRQTTLGYLNSLSRDELSEEVRSGEAWFGTLWLPAMPRAEHFLNIAEHEFYHVGQLISYLWARGDDPYKW